MGRDLGNRSSALARLLLGKGRFVDDVHLDRMVEGAFVRSPRAHAELRGIDATKAMAAGALAVITARDLPFLDVPYVTRYWHASIRGKPAPFLAVDRVRYVGEPVAFVVARDRYEAEDLASLVEVDYEELPGIGSIESARGTAAPVLHPEWIGNVAATYSHRHGDMPVAMAACERRLKRTFHFARQAPLPLETRGCVADFDASRQSLTVWLSTQTHYNMRQNLAAMLDLPEFNIRVIAEDVGGGFGSKSRAYPEEIIASYASKQLGRPVKWIEDRFENLQATTHSRAMEIEIEVGYDTSGRVHALRETITLDIGGYIATSGIITTEVASGQMSGPYSIPHLESSVVCVGTNKTPIGTYRGAGQPESAFPLECMLDLVARDIGISAYEVRMRNFVHPHDMPFSPGTIKAGTRVVFDSGDYPATLSRAIEGSGYCESIETLPSGEVATWGLACGLETAGLVSGESARIQIDGAGYVTVASGMTTQGQGHAAAYGRVCADILGVSAGRVSVRMGDTGIIGFGRGAFGTRGTVIGANAIAGAAGALRAKALDRASILLQCPAAELTISDSRILRACDGSDTGLSIGDIARMSVPGVAPFGDGGALEEEFIYSRSDSMTFSFIAQIVHVALDPRTGFFRLLDFYVIHDAGRVLDSVLVDGQIIGGTVDGIGGALLSELLYSDDGQLLTGSLSDYLVATATEVPRIRTDHYNTLARTNPLGVRGVGEGGIIPTAPAIVNALARIVSLNDLTAADGLFRTPVKPENVQRAIVASRQRASR